MKSALAESIGTFALVFAGVGAIVVDTQYGGPLGHVGISLVFGLVVMAMIYSVGDVSGAHLNPAVTLGFWIAKRLPGRDVPRFIAAQCVGAIAASALLRWLLTSEASGATTPSGSLSQSFVLEVMLTAGLMFVILSVTSGARVKGAFAGMSIGGTVALGALMGGPISGASMNPARSLGPALAQGELQFLWLYFAAPAVGAALGVLACRGVRPAGCCGAVAEE